VQGGQQLATNGTPNGVTACVGCHGAQGEGNAAGGFPRIAGQSAAYLGKQLGAYANGARVNPIMQPIAKAMNAVQIRDVSAYFASLGDAPTAVPAAAPAAADAGAAKPAAGGLDRGRTLSAIGDSALGEDYGAGLTEREVRYFIEREWAKSAEDVLWRRTKCGLLMSEAQRKRVERVMGR